MKAQELWNEYRRNEVIENCEYEAWAFGCDADLLAKNSTCLQTLRCSFVEL